MFVLGPQKIWGEDVGGADKARLEVGVKVCVYRGRGCVCVDGGVLPWCLGPNGIRGKQRHEGTRSS